VFRLSFEDIKYFVVLECLKSTDRTVGIKEKAVFKLEPNRL